MFMLPKHSFEIKLDFKGCFYDTEMRIGTVRGQTMNTPYPNLLWGSAFEHIKVSESTEILSEELWEILMPLYDEQSTYPKLLESVLLCYQLDHAAISAELHTFCKELLINYGLHKKFNLNFRSLFMIGRLIRQNMRNKSLEDYICYFLTAIISAAVE